MKGIDSETRIGLDDLLDAVKRLDAKTLETQLSRAAVLMSRRALIVTVIEPLMRRIGDLWSDGALRVAHEHLASAVVRSFLGNLNGEYGIGESAPGLIVTTPAGQMHELGALIVASMAMSEGWKVSYLGPNLPAEEIAAACEQNGLRAVALSIIYPPDDPHVIDELKKLKRVLPEDVIIFVGGRAAPAYREVLELIGAIHIEDSRDFADHLRALREPKRLKKSDG